MKRDDRGTAFKVKASRNCGNFLRKNSRNSALSCRKQKHSALCASLELHPPSSAKRQRRIPFPESQFFVAVKVSAGYTKKKREITAASKLAPMIYTLFFLPVSRARWLRHRPASRSARGATNKRTAQPSDRLRSIAPRACEARRKRNRRKIGASLLASVFSGSFSI